MMCRKCTIAGYLCTEANRAVTSELAEAIQELARGWHRECTDKRNCTCQHVIGKVIREEREQHEEEGHARGRGSR